MNDHNIKLAEHPAICHQPSVCGVGIEKAGPSGETILNCPNPKPCKDHETPYNQRDHSHCWLLDNHIKGHLICCLCKVPNPNVHPKPQQVKGVCGHSRNYRVKGTEYCCQDCHTYFEKPPTATGEGFDLELWEEHIFDIVGGALSKEKYLKLVASVREDIKQARATALEEAMSAVPPEKVEEWPRSSIADHEGKNVEVNSWNACREATLKALKELTP